MKVKVLKELIKEDVLDINNKETFESVINLSDEVSIFLLNIKSKKTKKSLIEIFELASNADFYEELTISISKINEEILAYSLPIINYLIESHYTVGIGKEKIIHTINSLCNVESKDTVNAIKNMVNNLEFLIINEEYYKTAITLIGRTKDSALLKIYLKFILNKYLQNGKFYTYVLNEIQSIEDANILEVLLNIITDEDLKEQPQYFKYIFGVAKDTKDIDTLYPLSEILIYVELLKLPNYITIVDRLINTPYQSKPTYYNAFLDIIYKIERDKEYKEKYYIDVIDTLYSVPIHNIWDFINLATNENLYTTDHYRFALKCFTQIKNSTICEQYCDLASSERLLENEDYKQIISLASKIEDTYAFSDFDDLTEYDTLIDNDNYLFALEVMSKQKTRDISRAMFYILSDNYVVTFSNYRLIVNKIIELNDINKIKLISEFLTWNKIFDDESLLTSIIEHATKIDSTKNLENYFRYIKYNSGFKTEYLTRTSLIISKMKNPSTYETLVNTFDTIYRLKSNETKNKNTLFSSIPRFLGSDSSNEDKRVNIILSLPLEIFSEKLLRNLNIAILDKNLYNSNYFEYAINLFRVFNDETCEVLTKIITSSYLLKRGDYKEIINRIIEIKSISHLKHLSKLIKLLENDIVMNNSNLLNIILNKNDERIVVDITNILTGLSKIAMINTSPIEIIEEYLKDPNKEKIKLITRISSSQNDTVLKHKQTLYLELLSKGSLSQKSIYYLNIPKRDKNIIEEELLDTSTFFQTESIILFAQTATTEELLKELESINDNEEVSTLTLKKRK